ncbi:hypothetical protein LTR97_012212 [Elasticomyces elasticus]|uniref:Uncharacterized protein n=1 Tax=Elasticomyces elasticus TaxID=574655 RepID=A0AAN7VL38_9PEZI|nr:hypothetical protein LTR97_012212 [Elasticomyces elasticus]
MDPATSPPTDELRQRISSALESYVSKLFKINYEKLCSAVYNTNVEFDAEFSSTSEHERADSNQERLWTVQEYLSGEYGGRPSELEDLVTNIDDLLDPDMARRILPTITDPPETLERFGREMRKIESGVQAQTAMQSDDGDVDSDGNVALPNEYRVLMSLCDRILPPGLHSEVSSNSMIAIRGLFDVKVPPLDELKERLCLESAGYTVHAGFITEGYCEGERYSVRRYNSWDYEDGVYLDDNGNPIDD